MALFDTFREWGQYFAAPIREGWDAFIDDLNEHTHPMVYKQLVPLDVYIDVKERSSEWSLHGGFISLATGQPLDSTPTDISGTVGRGKLFIVVNAGSDYDGSITVTGTSVDRNSGAVTPDDTEIVIIDMLTTDDSDTDANGNPRYSFEDGYITGKWFTGAITLSTADLTLTDVDLYQVGFEQCNDEQYCELLTVDFSGITTNTAAWVDFYGYLVETPGAKCNIVRFVGGSIPSSEISANELYRGRRGLLNQPFDGRSEGFWLDVFPGPLNQNYWEDINIKVWVEVTKTVNTLGASTLESLDKFLWLPELEPRDSVLDLGSVRFWGDRTGPNVQLWVKHKDLVGVVRKKKLLTLT